MSRIAQFSEMLEVSFDAGLLVDAGTGDLLSSNEPAQELFGNDDNNNNNNNKNNTVDDLITFYNNKHEPVPWRDAMMTESPCTMPAAVKNRDVVASATVRLKRFQCIEGDCVMLFVRSEQQVQPTITVNDRGIVLGLNDAAKDSLRWNGDDLMGKFVARGFNFIRSESFGDEDDNGPTIFVNDIGTILGFNEQAVKHIPWCSYNFVGCHISTLAKTRSQMNASRKNTNGTEPPSRASSVRQEIPTNAKKGWSFRKRFTRTFTSVRTEKPKEQRKQRNIRIVISSEFSNMFRASRTSASEALKRESTMAAIIEASIDPLVQINENGIIEVVNAAAVKTFGWSREQLLGSDISLVIGGNHANFHDEYVANFLARGTSPHLGKRRELTAKRADGSEFPVEITLVEVDTFAGEQRMFCGFIRDLSDLRSRDNRKRAILEASLDPVFIFTSKGEITMMNEAAVKNFGYSRDEFSKGTIAMLLGGDRAERTPSDIFCELEGMSKTSDKKCELLGRHKDGHHFPMELAVVQLESLGEESNTFCGFVHNLSDIRDRERISKGILESSLDAMFQTDANGIIQMVNETATRLFGYSKHEFLGHNLQMILSSVDNGSSSYQALAPENISKRMELHGARSDGSRFPIEMYVVAVGGLSDQQCFCSFVRDMTDMKQAERLTKGMVEASMDPVFQIDTSGVIMLANDAAVRCFGYSRDEFEGSNISMICGGGHASRHGNYIRRYLETGDKRIMRRRRELPAVRKDGTEFQVDLAVVEIDNGAGERFFCGYMRDLCDIKLKEDVTKGIVEASYDPVFLFSGYGIIQMVNKAATTQFGWTRDEFVDSDIDIIVGGRSEDGHLSYIRDLMSKGVGKGMRNHREITAKRKDGSEFLVEIVLAEVASDYSDERLFCGFLRDLTDEKKKENDILKNWRLTRAIIETSADPLFEINHVGIIKMVNNAATSLFGWTREEFLGSNINMIMDTDHSGKHDEYMKRYIETGIARTIGRRRQFNARTKYGDEFPIEISVTEIEADEGDERLFCGYIRDLTQQIEYEDELKRSEEFTNKIIESSHDALLVVDRRGWITRVNQAAVTALGCSRQELCRTRIGKFLSEEDSGWLQDQIQQFLNVGIPLSEEKEVDAKRVDGSLFPALLVVSEVEGEEGEDFFAIFAQDMSDRRRMVEIEIERAASEVLLMNVLPEQIATRLKKDPHHIADSHECGSILFADIVGFTTMSSKMEAQDVVAMLNELFSKFDELVERYEINKIKTIGDCYMAASVPSSTDDNFEDCRRVCHFALDMIDALHDYNREYPGHKLDLRIGVNCGPVVAGVVGTKRFLYDLWGDAVNTASRMESTGLPGQVQVTKAIFDMVGDTFRFERRGLVHVKGKGEMETFILKERRGTAPYKPKQTRQRPVLRRASIARTAGKNGLFASFTFMDASTELTLGGKLDLARISEDISDES